MNPVSPRFKIDFTIIDLTIRQTLPKAIHSNHSILHKSFANFNLTLESIATTDGPGDQLGALAAMETRVVVAETRHLATHALEVGWTRATEVRADLDTATFQGQREVKHKLLSLISIHMYM